MNWKEYFIKRGVLVTVPYLKRGGIVWTRGTRPVPDFGG